MELTYNKLTNIKRVQKDVDGPTDRIIRSKQKALKQSINEGIASSISTNLGSQFITPFALALKSTPFQIGILSSLSGLASPISQLFGSKLMSHESRKRIVVEFVLLEALVWFPIALLGILFWKGYFQNFAPYILIILYTILLALGSCAYPAWFSWLGDLIPEKDRGKYLGIRDRIITLLGLAAMLFGAFLLDTFKTKGFVFLGFAILFALAFTFRFVSYKIFKKEYSPKFKVNKKSYFTLWNFIKTFDNYGKFATYNLFFNIAVMIASPFFAVYMLQELEFSYTTFIIVSISGTVFYLIFAPLAGKFSDKYGNVRLFYIANLFFFLSPIPWLFIKNPIALVFAQIIPGIGNAALLISSTNFTYASVSQQRRGICVAYNNLFTGIGVFIGSIIGGILLKYLAFTNKFLFVFALAAAARLLVGIIFLPRLKDKRKVRPLPDLKVSLLHPIKSVHSEINLLKTLLG
ncbi:MFS transporter [Candidatus Pacearchaeota archaeon]|nr:MFS transporter [Candidatus Pacearchaeota archaeon]